MAARYRAESRRRQRRPGEGEPAVPAPAAADDLRVSSVELFFDLVFVFTITELTSLLVAEPSVTGLAKALLIVGNIWWMYGGYAWLTNAVPPSTPVLRLLMLVGMAGFLIVALAIPSAFGSSGVAFGIGYLVVTAVHTGMFLKSSQGSVIRAMARLGPYNAITAGMLLAAAFVPGNARWSLWITAFVLHWSSPAVTAVGGFRIRAAHFVERHGLIVLIALGESVVAAGIGLQHQRLSAGLIGTALLGLAVAAELWWMYFDGEDRQAERALGAAPAQRCPWLALFAFGYAFLPLLASVIVFAAGVKLTALNYARPASVAAALLLAGGVAGYVASLAALRLILRSGPVAIRLLVAALALAAAVAGREVSPATELAALGLVLAAGIGLERRRAGRETPHP